LEAIAAAAGISRRTFFYYFRSKDEVLLASQGGGFIEAVRPALLEESPDQAPFVAVRNCLSKLVSRYETKESIIIDRLLQSTEALRARKQAIFVQMEETVFAALCELWPEPERRTALRLVAMVSIGLMRVAMEALEARRQQASVDKVSAGKFRSHGGRDLKWRYALLNSLTLTRRFRRSRVPGFLFPDGVVNAYGAKPFDRARLRPMPGIARRLIYHVAPPA
jgi:AcrR family transcriptional regulator